MNKLSAIIIINLLVLLGFVLFLKKRESDKFNSRIEILEDLRRLNYIEIDSLTVSTENQKEYIKNLEKLSDSLDVVNNLSKLKIVEYEEQIKNYNTHFFNNSNDSVIVGVLSNVRFNP